MPTVKSALRLSAMHLFGWRDYSVNLVLRTAPDLGEVLVAVLGILCKYLNTVSLSVSKEQLLAKMQEFDALLKTMAATMQSAVKVRTELWSMIANVPDDIPFDGLEIPLTFYEGGHVIAWGNDSEHFTPSTFRLIQQLWIAPDRTLSKEDVRQDVLGDEESKPGSIWSCISRVRQELMSVDFPYTILTQRGRGYRLARTQGT